MVKPKKYLGQHFLTDGGTAKKIAAAVVEIPGELPILEVGPGTGMLTRALPLERLHLIETDQESVQHLKALYPDLAPRLLLADFLKVDLGIWMQQRPFILAGNFPYNISSQICFKMLEHVSLIPFMVGMFQKEVAQRIAAPHNNKEYGILSVLLQSYYDCRYLFTVRPGSFYPPPKVDSGVIILQRKPAEAWPPDYPGFARLVKTSFSMRRKTLRNNLKVYGSIIQGRVPQETLNLRAEALSPEDFLKLYHQIHH